MSDLEDFPGLQPGDAWRDAIRVAEDVLDAKVLDKEQLSDEEVVGRADLIRLRALRSRLTREQAIEQGAKLGANEADRRGETGLEREQRVARARAYAAWEYDGKPTDGSHMREMGVAQQSENLKVLAGPDWKKGKR